MSEVYGTDNQYRAAHADGVAWRQMRGGAGTMNATTIFPPIGCLFRQFRLGREKRPGMPPAKCAAEAAGEM
jgi:hypothetical protein